MSRVLLIDPSGSHAQAKYVRKQRPNIGLAYIASALLKKSHEVKVIDLNIQTQDELKGLLLSWHPDITGISAMTFNILEAYDIAGFIKSLNGSVTVVLGGIHVTALSERTMTECREIDIGVVGEGEETICEIADGIDLKNIEGIVFRNEEAIISNPHRSRIRDLHSLLFPAWQLFDVNEYRKIYSRRLKRSLNELIVIGSRGCPEKCTFCYRTGGGRFVRFRTAESVIDEITYNLKTFGIRFFHMGDSSLMMKHSFFEKVCHLMIENGLNKEITWVCEARVNEVSEEKVLLLKNAGCEYLYLGIESGSQKILDLMKKDTTKEQIRSAVKAAKKVGMPVGGQFIFGHPGENRDTIKESIQFALELGLNNAGFNILDLYPGTELWRDAEKGGGERWRISGDLYKWTKRTRRNSNIILNEISNRELEVCRKKAEKKFRRQRLLREEGIPGLIRYEASNIILMLLKKIGIYEFSMSLREKVKK